MNGSIILCDHVYETRDKKFIISGTYNQWRCMSNTLKIPHLHCYIRLYPERTGAIQAQIELRDNNQTPDQAPMLRAEIDLDVRAEHIPVMEFAFNSRIPAEITVQFQPDSNKGACIRVPLSLILSIDGEVVATSPLSVIFTNS